MGVTDRLTQFFLRLYVCNTNTIQDRVADNLLLMPVMTSWLPCSRGSRDRSASGDQPHIWTACWRRLLPPLAVRRQRRAELPIQAIRAGTSPRLLKQPAVDAIRVIAAGFSEHENDTVSDRLVESLFVSGDEDKIRDRLLELLSTGVDELTISLETVSDAVQERFAWHG
jgi:hypothetical protein